MQPNTTSPQPPPVSLPTDIEQVQKTNRLKLTWGIICLTLPTVLFIITVVGYTVIEYFIIQQTANYAASDSLFPDRNPIIKTLNIILRLSSIVSILAWLPGIITGIILLATRKRV